MTFDEAFEYARYGLGLVIDDTEDVLFIRQLDMATEQAFVQIQKRLNTSPLGWDLITVSTEWMPVERIPANPELLERARVAAERYNRWT